MNFRSKNNAVLLIIGKDELPKIASYCSNALSNEGTKILTATTGIDGIFAFNRFSPCIVIVDDTLPDMRGSSVCSVIRDSVHGKDAANIFFVGDCSSYLFKTYADFFFQKPLQYDLLNNVFKEFFYRRKTGSPEYISQISGAVRRQQNELPQKLETSLFVVDNVFSAYSELSGDGLEYRVSDNGDLYGFIFDNTGHDILAYSSTSQIRTLLKISFDLYQKGMIPTLGKILSSLNNNLFTVSDDDPSPVAIILFHISFDDGQLFYTPAGMPCIYTDYGDGFIPVKMRNPVVGGFRNVDYENYSLPLDGIERILFASDGLSELLTLGEGSEPPTDFAKHDDVSGIIVSIKRG